MLIIPSILTNDSNELRSMLTQLEGVADRVSIDIIDGKFAENKTIEPDLLFDIETSLKIDYQLMVVDPVNWIEKCVRGQADRIIGHVEKMSDQLEFIGRVEEVGSLVGLGVDLKTPVSSIEPEIINNLDIVLVMGVAAGFGGQEFDKSILVKVKELNDIRKRDNTSFKIHVDGGVRETLIKAIADAGADEVSVGRRLFSGNINENIEKYLRKL